MKRFMMWGKYRQELKIKTKFGADGIAKKGQELKLDNKIMNENKLIILT